ncbi:hypothetical protein D9615_010474 [Tricholomella constricta]|uniref:Uncharacterized protein n=1 Tax=Tricholomella constricta TaxID=117010 RepID=A0A8H5LRY7_9AGAR|nr:hypothetical protein D9615_010474 [Tricholomella constricta]
MTSIHYSDRGSLLSSPPPPFHSTPAPEHTHGTYPPFVPPSFHAPEPPLPLYSIASGCPIITVTRHLPPSPAPAPNHCAVPTHARI